MPLKISKTMDEVHRWREEIYKETKKMDLREKLEYFHRGIDKICMRYGLNPVSFKETHSYSK